MLTDTYIALAEVRPHIGAKVSIATIAVKEPLNLLDFTMQPPFPKMPEVKQGILEDLSELFSRPVAKNDEILDYIPTQFIAEYVKRLGYDGITFSSSVTPEFRKNEPDRHNVVVFNYEKCEAIKSNMFEVERTYVEAKQIDSDRNLLNIESYILERLREI